jgi:hypothetical protein
MEIMTRSIKQEMNQMKGEALSTTEFQSTSSGGMKDFSEGTLERGSGNYIADYR